VAGLITMRKFHENFATETFLEKNANFKSLAELMIQT
jgi:hypothetical protein